jgi:hypothetical protein
VNGTLTGVRDSKNPDGPALRFDNPGVVTRLLDAIKRDQL